MNDLQIAWFNEVSKKEASRERSEAEADSKRRQKSLNQETVISFDNREDR